MRFIIAAFDIVGRGIIERHIVGIFGNGQQNCRVSKRTCFVDNHRFEQKRRAVVAIHINAAITQVLITAHRHTRIDERLQNGIAFGKRFAQRYGQIAFVAGRHTNDGLLTGQCKILSQHAFAVVRTQIATQRQIDDRRLIVVVTIVQNIFYTERNETVLQRATRSHNVRFVSHAVERTIHIGHRSRKLAFLLRRLCRTTIAAGHGAQRVCTVERLLVVGGEFGDVVGRIILFDITQRRCFGINNVTQELNAVRAVGVAEIDVIRV